jgi:putative transposase
LDEGEYYCSWRTMYRIVAEQGGRPAGHRRRQRLTYSKPELVARGPNQVWSWDITFLSGPKRGCFYYLYVIVDIFSRYVVGWMVAEAESAEWARQLIEATCIKQNIQPDQLTLHADRGGAMKALAVADLLAQLGVTKSHSRPHTADDNPYSESQFKTLKQHSTFPKQFAGIQAARSWASVFFDWYNHDHHHVALGLMTPAVVHDGQAEAVRTQRQQVLNQAFACHPDRFPAGPPRLSALPKEVWINQPPATIGTAETLPALPLVVAPTHPPAG